MHIIVNVIDPTGLASTGASVSNGLLLLLAGALTLAFGFSAVQHFTYAQYTPSLRGVRVVNDMAPHGSGVAFGYATMAGLPRCLRHLATTGAGIANNATTGGANLSLRGALVRHGNPEKSVHHHSSLRGAQRSGNPVISTSAASTTPTVTKRWGGGLHSVFVVFACIPALVFALLLSNGNVQIAQAATQTADDVTITVERGSTNSATATLKVDNLAASTVNYNVHATLARVLDNGLNINLNGADLATSEQQVHSQASTVLESALPISATASTDIAAGTYEYDLNLRTEELDGSGAVVPSTPPAPPTPPGPTGYADRLSSDNTTFADTTTNFAGGDLIIKQVTPADDAEEGTEAFSSTPGNNIITLVNGGTSVTCTTTGQKYVPDAGAAAGNVPAIGCVIPNLGVPASKTDYEVFVEVNGSGQGAQKVGDLDYDKFPAHQFPNTCIQQMQNFTAAGCKLNLHQGQSIRLSDTRGGADIGYGAGEYRVKKMPDGNVWQIDNLALDPSTIGITWGTYDGHPEKLTCTTYPSTGCTSSTNAAPQWTDAAYVTGSGSSYYAYANHSYGYLYNWCAATADTSTGCTTSKNLATGEMPNSLAPAGWKLPLGTTAGADKSFYALATAMETEAANNPVYNGDSIGSPSYAGQQNWRNNSGTLSPFGGVYSGYYYSDLYSQDYGTGGVAYYWSSTAYSGRSAWYSHFDFGGAYPGTDSEDKNTSFALRAVL